MPQNSFLKLSAQRRKVIIDTGIAVFSQRSYADVGTDAITKQCGISKGLLFHYFGSKREYYFYCVEQAMELAAMPAPMLTDGQIYDVLFSLLANKIRLCQQYPNEMRLSMMATRETCAEVKEGKTAILTHYLAKSRVDAAEVMALAAEKLSFRPDIDTGKATAALAIYVQALISRYFEKYQDRPEAFFKNMGTIKKEFSEYIEFLLVGMAD